MLPLRGDKKSKWERSDSNREPRDYEFVKTNSKSHWFCGRKPRRSMDECRIDTTFCDPR